jgi:translation initiation factor 2 alpha subunit (eIF-2alpha)
MRWKEDDVVLCTVKKIEGATVFVELEDGASGNLVLSEVAAGRIRNLRVYVTPGKKIVCKVLKVRGDNLELSLRRVTGKERESVLEGHRKEKTLKGMLKAVVDEPDKVIEKIKEKYEILDFFDEARENPSVFEDFLKKEDAEKVIKILSEKGEKEKFVEGKFVLNSAEENGVDDIKSLLDVGEKIFYLGSSTFLVSVSGKDFKEANSKLQKVLDEIAKRAKGKKAEFEIVKEK